MQFENLVQSLRALARADSVIADLTFRSRMSQVALQASALVVALFGVVMLGIAGYLWLSQSVGPVLAALIVAAASLALALLLLFIASRRTPGREIELAREMHNTALESLVTEVRRTGDASPLGLLFGGGSLDRALIGLIGPLAMMLLRMLRGGSGEKPKEG
jgi:hypothetical protein